MDTTILEYSRLEEDYIGHMPAWMLEVSEETKERSVKLDAFIYNFLTLRYDEPPDLLILQTVYDEDFSISMGYVNSETDKTTYRTLDQAMNILLDRLEDWIEEGLYKDMYYD